MAKIVNTRKDKAKDNEQSYSLSTNYYALKNNDLKLLTPEEELELAKVIAQTTTNVSNAVADAFFVVAYILELYSEYRTKFENTPNSIDSFILGFKDINNTKTETNNEQDNESLDDSNLPPLELIAITNERFELLKIKYEEALTLASRFSSKSTRLSKKKEEISEILKNFIFSPRIYEKIEVKLDNLLHTIIKTCSVFKTMQQENPRFTKSYYTVQTYLNDITTKNPAEIVFITENQYQKIIEKNVLVEPFVKDVTVALQQLNTIKDECNHSIEDIIKLYNNIKTQYLIGKQARDQMIKANIRLVMHEARKYSSDTDNFNDLTQYGIFGLIKAIEKFDYTKKYKLSTYATWWIKQYINRALDTDFKSIRLPVNKEEKIKKINKFAFDFFNTHGREARNDEIAKGLGITTKMVNELKFYSRPTVSLHDKIPNDKDDENLSIEYTQKDENTPTPTQIAELESLKQCLADVLKELTPQEADIIKKRFGLNNQNTLTLEQIAKTYNVKAERIRQIEAKTLRKISHSSKFSHLKDFLEVSDY